MLLTTKYRITYMVLMLTENLKQLKNGITHFILKPNTVGTSATSIWEEGGYLHPL